VASPLPDVNCASFQALSVGSPPLSFVLFLARRVCESCGGVAPPLVHIFFCSFPLPFCCSLPAFCALPLHSWLIPNPAFFEALPGLSPPSGGHALTIPFLLVLKMRRSLPCTAYDLRHWVPTAPLFFSWLLCLPLCLLVFLPFHGRNRFVSFCFFTPLASEEPFSFGQGLLTV